MKPNRDRLNKAKTEILLNDLSGNVQIYIIFIVELSYQFSTSSGGYLNDK